MSEEAVSWTRDAAAHLLRRAGFGGTPAEIDDLFARGLVGAVSRLVDYEAIDVTAYEAALNARGYNLTTNRGLQQWALDRMTFSPRPLEEKMTYFWNLHWTSGLAKVQGVTLMLNQNKTMRQYAVGKFDDLVIKISQDPAMLIWLDNWLSRVGRPNENYGRELMELFTLGVDSGYTQTDVTMVARALTGWTLLNVGPNQNNNAIFFDSASQHDNGVKTILGADGQLECQRCDRHHSELERRLRLEVRAVPDEKALDVLRLRQSARCRRRSADGRLDLLGPLDPRGSPRPLPDARSSTSFIRARSGFGAPSSTRSRRCACWEGRAILRPFSIP